MYRLEIFDSALVNRDAVLLSESQTISLDYLTMEPFTVTAPKEVEAEKGWYAHIADGTKTVCDCVVSDVQPEKDTTTISLRPLQAICDFDVWASPIDDVGAWIAQQISEQLITNEDTLQRLPVSVTNTADVYPAEVDGDTVNVLEVICNAITAYNVVTDARINFSTGKIDFLIHSVTQQKIIEADLENVLDKSITLGDSYGSTNKLVLQQYTVDKDTKEETVVGYKSYFLHPDGTVDDEDTDRITPVFWALKRLKDEQKEEKPWDVTALETAVEMLTPEKYDNEILLTYQTSDKIVNPATLQLGMVAVIIVRGVSYLSILTGVNITERTTQLVFGNVRVALTKKLLLERR